MTNTVNANTKASTKAKNIAKKTGRAIATTGKVLGSAGVLLVGGTLLGLHAILLGKDMDEEVARNTVHVEKHGLRKHYINGLGEDVTKAVKKGEIEFKEVK